MTDDIPTEDLSQLSLYPAADRAKLRIEWLRAGCLNASDSDRLLRERVAGLLEVDTPTAHQMSIFSTADHLLTALDLPGAVYESLKGELETLVREECERPDP